MLVVRKISQDPSPALQPYLPQESLYAHYMPYEGSRRRSVSSSFSLWRFVPQLWEGIRVEDVEVRKGVTVLKQNVLRAECGKKS